MISKFRKKKINYQIISDGWSNFWGPPWSHGSWIYIYLYNQCLSQPKLWVRILLRRGVLDTTFCDRVCQWLATGLWFSPGTPVSSTNKTNRHDITEILLKVALKTMTHDKFIWWVTGWYVHSCSFWMSHFSVTRLRNKVSVLRLGQTTYHLSKQKNITIMTYV